MSGEEGADSAATDAKHHDESVEVLPTLKATSLMSSTTMAASSAPADLANITSGGGGGGSPTNLRRSTTTPHAERESRFAALIAQRRQANQRHLHVSTLSPTAEEEEEEAEADEEVPEAAASRPNSPTTGRRRIRGASDNNNLRESTFQNITPDKFEQHYLQNNRDRLVQVVLRDYSYHVPIRTDAPSIKTVLNQSVCYGAFEFFRRIHDYCQRQDSRAEDIILPFTKKSILSNITLCFDPGKTYLILAPPGGGKTTILKAIAGLLPTAEDLFVEGKPMKDKPHESGRIEFNGVTTRDEPGMILPNIVSFVGQLDNHAPYLTVKETFEFAHNCRTGKSSSASGDAANNNNSQGSAVTENLTIEGLDLAHVANTFVGNDDVRGVSGGQRRRVTVGEMMQGQNPVACADEISTGLDAAVTYDIVRSIVDFSKKAMTTRIISLLQPGPETVSLFDQIVLLAEGKVVYAGPIEEVVEYFEALGYRQPATMDVGDYVQSVPTPDGEVYFDAASSAFGYHLTSHEFADEFKKSTQYQRILAKLEPGANPHQWLSKNQSKRASNFARVSKDAETGGVGDSAIQVPKQYFVYYQNSFFRSLSLNFKRHLTLWLRDWGFIIGKMFENIGMAVATGGILFGQARLSNLDGSESVEELADKYAKLTAGIYGALFMTTFHILLGTMTSAPDEVSDRSIHYKHDDANFYQAFAFVFGRLISTFPQRTIEIVSFGIPLYWMVGLDPTAASFFTYLALLICYTIGMKLMFSILAQTLPKKANVQGTGTFLVLLMTLFSGFIIYPVSIPNYYYWIYYSNPMAWALQGLVSNEFMSTKYEDAADGFSFEEDFHGGEDFLQVRGFHTGREWIWYSFAFMIPFTFFSGLVLGIVLKTVRIEPEVTSVKKKNQVEFGKAGEEGSTSFNLPFTPVDLTFEKVVYEVKASTGDDTLKLLNEVSGVFSAGRMVALMGSSGAGKTTLMDVIAMRKDSGTTTGDIRLNGFEQERESFLRVSGYVEQFDIQQPELTVRETVAFCARLRLDAKDPGIKDDAGKMRFVTHVLQTMELTDIETLQVGSYEEGGLSFEQRKRLAIACELAGSPSVIFLDEPTSGLDSRGALVVIRAMKRITNTGRTVCSTIHQPSGAVFEMFDDLLLLTKGGNTVFCGELGPQCSYLIDYFENRGATPISFGENPAAWMLRAQTSGAAAEVNWIEEFKTSEQFESLQKQIATTNESPDDSKKLSFDEVYPTTSRERVHMMNRRVLTVYKRSPAYNLARLSIALLYAFIIGSVFLGGRRINKTVWLETEVDAVISVMFLSLIIIGVTSISMAVPVTKTLRDVFYKHRASGMLTHKALSGALFLGEVPYICLISVLFGCVFYATVGLFASAKKFWYFWLFFGLNVAIYAYFGQAFICLVKDTPTAGALVGALIGYNVFFSGLIVKPQYFVGPFQLGFWTAPGRFAFEGLATSQFKDIDLPVVASFGSPWFYAAGCNRTLFLEATLNNTDLICEGTMDEYVNFYFGGRFKYQNFWLDVGCLLGYLLLSRILSYWALKKFNYSNS